MEAEKEAKWREYDQNMAKKEKDEAAEKEDEKGEQKNQEL